MTTPTRALLLLTCTLLLPSATVVPAQQQSWTGRISDSLCRLRHEEDADVAGGGRQEKLTDHQCVLACIKGGSKYVFVTNDKVYQIVDQRDPLLEKYAGEDVKLTGEMKDQVITVSRIEAP